MVMVSMMIEMVRMIRMVICSGFATSSSSFFSFSLFLFSSFHLFIFFSFSPFGDGDLFRYCDQQFIKAMVMMVMIVNCDDDPSDDHNDNCELCGRILMSMYAEEQKAGRFFLTMPFLKHAVKFTRHAIRCE